MGKFMGEFCIVLVFTPLTFISGYANKGTVFYCLNCEFLDVHMTGMHSIITSCSIFCIGA